MDSTVHPRVSRPPHRTPYRLIDLFAGAGGFTLGFVDTSDELLRSVWADVYRHGQLIPPFQPVWANDCDEDAARSYNANFGHCCTVGDILEILEGGDNRIPQADVVIGGLPCQGFSLLNRKRKGDERRALWEPFLDVVARSGADVFVVENVAGILGSPEYARMKAKAEDAGFTVRAEVLLAADYGVPQLRRRAFVVGCRFADPAVVFPPKKTHYDDEKAAQPHLGPPDEYVSNPQPWRTFRQAAGDLPEPHDTKILPIDPPTDLHFRRNPTKLSMERYRAIPNEGDNRIQLQERRPDLTPRCWREKKSGGTDLFGRLWMDKPAVTIRTEFYKPEKGRYLHPSQDRAITHREAARLQTFPDSFRFHGSKIRIARQIGNAVPPLLAAHMARCVYDLLARREGAPHGR